MIGKAYAWWCWFWNNHVQKTFGTILFGSSLFDLMSAWGLYEVTLTQILGMHLYNVIRGALTLAMVIRAALPKREKQ